MTLTLQSPSDAGVCCIKRGDFKQDIRFEGRSEDKCFDIIRLLAIAGAASRRVNGLEQQEQIQRGDGEHQ